MAFDDWFGGRNSGGRRNDVSPFRHRRSVHSMVGTRRFVSPGRNHGTIGGLHCFTQYFQDPVARIVTGMRERTFPLSLAEFVA